MKHVLALLASTFFATTTLAGEVSMSSAAHLPEEQAMMGSGGTQWIVPLLAIALIAIAVSSDGEKKKLEVK